MPDTPPPVSNPAVPAPAAPSVETRSAQDRKIAESIVGAQTMIQAAQQDPEITALMAARGYDAAKLQAGLALQVQAQASFTRRQNALGTRKSGTDVAQAQATVARRTYTDFRETCRAAFRDRAALQALGVTGTTPADMQQFLTQARASYAAAKTGTYATTLGTMGFGPAALTAALDSPEALASSLVAQGSMGGAALQATADRDADAKNLQEWTSSFKRIARIALRGRGDLMAKLGL